MIGHSCTAKITDWILESSNLSKMNTNMNLNLFGVNPEYHNQNDFSLISCHDSSAQFLHKETRLTFFFFLFFV